MRNSTGTSIATVSNLKAVNVPKKPETKSQTVGNKKKDHTELPGRIIGSSPPTTQELLPIERAAQPISRTAVARRLGVTRGTVTVLV